MTRPTRAWAIVLAMTVLLGGCGLSADDEPQTIAPQNLPPDLLDPNPGSGPTLPESPGTTSVAVYFLAADGDRERLIEVPREVNDLAEPGERIARLFSQPTEAEAEDGLTTSIPADTVLIDIERDASGTEAVIELSNELFSIQGEELVKAFAQIVWTVTEPDGGIREVRFIVDGVEIRAPDASGVERDGAVSRADYTALSPRP